MDISQAAASISMAGIFHPPKLPDARRGQAYGSESARQHGIVMAAANLFLDQNNIHALRYGVMNDVVLRVRWLMYCELLLPVLVPIMVMMIHFQCALIGWMHLQIHVLMPDSFHWARI